MSFISFAFLSIYLQFSSHNGFKWIPVTALNTWHELSHWLLTSIVISLHIWGIQGLGTVSNSTQVQSGSSLWFHTLAFNDQACCFPNISSLLLLLIWLIGNTWVFIINLMTLSVRMLPISYPIDIFLNFTKT